MAGRGAPVGSPIAFTVLGSTFVVVSGTFLAFGRCAADTARTATTGGVKGASESKIAPILVDPLPAISCSIVVE